MATYKINAGDTLTSIAKKYGTTVSALASANNIKNVNLINAGATLTIPGSNSASTSTTKKTTTTSAPTKASTSASSTAKATNLSGVSANTNTNLNKYSQQYGQNVQSNAVSSAESYLNSILNNKPGDFSSKYSEGLANIYDQITNREKFSYDLDSDMLYQQAKDQYTALGKQAMQDTMGQASALTGGYGNSYASTAGNQAYQSYLTQLNNNIPDYYNMARNAYDTETSDLYNQYSMNKDLYDTDYSKYRDTVSDWNNDRSYAYGNYRDEQNIDQNSWNQAQSYWQNQAQLENSNYWDKTNYDESIRQYNQNMAYQQQRDAVADSQWQKEYAASQAAAAKASAQNSSAEPSYSGLTDTQQKQIEFLGDTGNNSKLDNYIQTLVDRNVISDEMGYELYKRYAVNSSTSSAKKKIETNALKDASPYISDFHRMLGV